MAYAAIVSLKLTLQNILLHPHRYSIPCWEKKHIESFHEKLEFLQQLLEEYPSHESEEAACLETRIRRAAHEAEDFMDLHLENLLDSEKMEELIPTRCIEVIDKFNDITGEVIEIKKQMEIDKGRDSIMKEEMETSKFGKRDDFELPDAFHMDSSLLVPSDDKKNLTVGFDDHLMQIKDQLTRESSVLEVISIMGMGGIGKTTLATHIYNDPYIVNHFDIRSWAVVSQSYSVRDILLGVLGSMKMLTKEMYRESDDRLGLRVYQTLKHRRYLITIDDIWDTKAWDGLKMMFPDDNNGSRIMLTTRIANVAAYASPSGTTLHHISLLSHDQSWKLLCSKVFGDEPCPLNLQEIGKRIAENCRGLPLSIVVIGGLLSKVKNTQVAWQSVADNVTSLVFSSYDRCLNIIRLSYNYLPQYLKACFLYMGIFPKNYEICVSKIIQLWIAEGFLRQAHGQSPEEVAQRCVEELLDRNLILMSKKNFHGNIKGFRIHDLLFDFCVKEAENQEFLRTKLSHADLYFRTISASQRRVGLLRRRRLLFYSLRRPSTSYVRSIVCVGQCHVFLNSISRFKLLRILDATRVYFRYFPSEVLELLSLRYIALLCDGDIPTSIIKLWNLQTLIISGYSPRSSKNRLPPEIWMMVHLRHVWFDRGRSLDASAANRDFSRKRLVLKDLQTLSGLWNLRFTKEVLQSIPNIKKIDVSYHVLGLLGKEWSTYYQLENLGELHHLKELKIRASPDLCWSPNLIPPSIQFPQTLKTLTLCAVGIPWHDLAIIGSLPHLEVLKLKDHACIGTEWEPNEEEFPQLKVLVLDLLELKHWKADSYHFPSLQRLIIRRCNNLEEIPSGMGESPTLTTIELYECKASARASANEIKEQQLSYGNEGFQVIYNADPKPKASWRTWHSLLRFLKSNSSS